MPFWGAATLSGALFFLGLAGLLWPRAQRARLASGALMLNGALLLAVAAAADLGALQGQAVALLLVGVLAAEAVLGARLGGEALMGMGGAFVALLLTALGLLIWESARPHVAHRVAPYLTLAALVAAFALSTAVPSGAASTQPALRRLLPDELGRLMRAVLLLGMVLRALVEPPIVLAPPAAQPVGKSLPAAHYALRLLAALGALLAVSTSDLLLLALGVALFAMATAFTARDERPGMERTRLLGLGALLFGVALLYASTATLDLDAMGRFLWTHPGPQAAMLYLGLGLAVGGLALLTRLIAWGPAPAPDDLGAASAVLGVATLLRLCVGALGALYYVWVWMVAALGLLAMLSGWMCSRRARASARLLALDSAQRGLLLLALAYAVTRGGLQTLFMALVAYWLAELVLATATRQLAEPGDAEADYTGLLARAPWLGAATLVGLFSLAGAPLTLGFAGRAGLLWAATDARLLGLAIAAVVLSALCAADYLQIILTLPRIPATDEPLFCPALVCVVLLIAALALIVLGIYPQVFGTWVARIAL